MEIQHFLAQISWNEIIFSEAEGFDLHRQEEGKFILRNMANFTSKYLENLKY